MSQTDCADARRPGPHRTSWGAAAGLLLALGAPLALAQSAASTGESTAPAAENSAAIEALRAELAGQKQAAEAAVARATAETDALRKELGALKAKLEQTQADTQAKADAIASLEKTRADLETQLAAARKELDAARAATEKALSDGSAKAAAIATLEQGRTELQAGLEAERAKLAAAEQATNERLAAAEKVAAEKLALAERRITAEADARIVVEGQLAALTKKLAAVETRLAVLENERDAATRTLDATLAKLPARDGGTKTIEQARARAAEAGAAFAAATEQARRQPSDETRAALGEATTVLSQAQYDVAVAIDARGVYRTRADDTLAMVAGRFYGVGNKWTAIHEANQHVLANPDRVLPGMTLVVP
jgi:nucleoid-associated protein YgaU